MRSPLETRIAALRGRVRRLLALHGLARVVAALVLAVVAACLFDWLVHLAPEVRLVALLGVVGMSAWLAWRHVFTPLVVRFQDLDIAMRVERRWPGLNDRLSSTIQFLKARGRSQDDYLGSPALREATVAQTLREAESIDFREVVDPRPARKASLAAAAAVGLGLALVAAAPADGRLALRRLLVPYGGDQWPKSTELLAPQFAKKVAKGEPFTLEVAVRKGKTVPSSAQVTYEFEDGERSTEALRPDGKGAFHGRIDAVSRAFTFKVAAGDDQTGRHPVAVVPPPALKDLAVRLTPPAYTGQAAANLAPGLTQIRAVEGTVVEVEAEANKPIAVAMLHKGGAGSPAVPAKVEDGGRKVSARFTVADSAPFWFSLKDTEPEGFTNREAARFEVRSVKDEAPRVVFEEPLGDREITADGVVPLRITADDDFGLQAIRLLYKISAGGSEATKSEVLGLWEPGTDQAAHSTKHQEVTHSWEMTPLALEPGSVITFYADARDFLPGPKGPNLGKSRELRLRIITREEAANRLEEQRRAIRDEAERILAMQKTALTPVREAINTLDRTKGLDRPSREQVRVAETVQRQVSGRVASPNDGLDQKVRQFLQDMKNLKVENPDALSQMLALKASVERIKDEHLDGAEQGLSRANKSLEGDDREKPEGANAKDQGDPKPGDKGEPQKGGDPKAGDQGDPKAGEKSDPKAAGKPGEKGDPKRGDKADGKPGEKADPKSAGKPGEKSDPKGGDDAQGGDKGDPQAGGDPKGGEKPGDKSGGKPQAPKDALAQAEKHQKAISEELQKMLDGMKELDTYNGVVKDAQKLLAQQEAALKESAAAAADPGLAGKNADALSPEQKADRENAAGRQNDIAKGLQALEQKMDGMAKQTDDADPLAAEALRDAAAQSRQKGTAGKMGEGAEQLAKNQMGSARSNQEQARQDLKELVQAIKDRREKELSRLAKALDTASKDMAKLREKQAELLKKTKEAGKNPDPKARKEELQKLAREQAEVEKELQKQLQRLKKLKADGASQAGGKAASKMGKAQKDLDEDDDDEAQKDEEEALADLDDAQQEIDEKKREVEEELAMEQFAKMKDTLKALKERQDKVVEETVDYQKARDAANDSLTPGQRVGVKGLSRVQSGLKEETTALAERLEGAPVFALTLKRAVENMDAAGQRLATIKTDDDTQRAEKAAARRFEQLLDALKADPPKPGGQAPPGGGRPGKPGAKGGDGIPTSAQVKMLKMLQQEVNLRTEELAELKERGKELTEQQEAEIGRLDDEQGSIADLARDLTRPKKDDGEE